MDAESDKIKLIEEIYQLERRISHTVHYKLTSWMALNLTIGQLKSLFYIDFQGSSNVRDLAAALGVTSPNVTGIIDRLVEQGLVSREENPENRRMLLLRTTDKGRALLAQLRESSTSRMSGILAQLTLEELAALALGLGAIARVAEFKGEKTGNEHC